MPTEDYLGIDYTSTLEKPEAKKLEPGRIYVVGFAFDEKVWQNILLIIKKRPDWQAGLLNGVGGKVEDEDVKSSIVTASSNQIAMAREFLEETMIVTEPSQWVPFCEVSDARGWKVIFHYTRCNTRLAQRVTDEIPIVIPFEDLHSRRWPVMPNLNWLIPMALTLMSDELPITMRPDKVKYFTIQETK